MPDRQAVESLKANWSYDPAWDIEHTEGFEEYHDELLAYRLTMEEEWAAERQERIDLKAAELECSKALAVYILALEHHLDTLNGVLENVYFRD